MIVEFSFLISGKFLEECRDCVADVMREMELEWKFLVMEERILLQYFFLGLFMSAPEFFA